MILNRVQCALCPDYIESENSFLVLTKAEELGWAIPIMYFQVGGEVICPKHMDEHGFIKAGFDGEWVAGCFSCEWEESFTNESDARDEERHHDCKDHRDDFPETYVWTPERVIKNNKERAKAEEARVMRERKYKAEQKLLADHREAIKQQDERLKAYGRKYLQIRRVIMPWKKD